MNIYHKKKVRVPHLKLVVNNGSLIDETQELLEMQKALITSKIEIQANIRGLEKRMKPITDKIFSIEQQLGKLRGNKNAGETSNP